MNKRLIRAISIVLSGLIIMGGTISCTPSNNVFNNEKNLIYEENGMKYVSKVEGRDFYVYAQGNWQKKFLKGVNIGAGKPGTFPGELAITQAEYLRWFQSISDMNADVIRVYTTLKPDFYDALYEFNKNAKKPLYLMQGVWVKEEDIAQLKDAYAENEKIKQDFIKDAKDLVDIFHGQAQLPEQPGFASGKYSKDISQYVIGWILGIEWDPYFVGGTNQKNPTKTSFSGDFLYTKDASPFETFLCEAGDSILDYEASQYKMTRALSFTNWLTTDMLAHPNEPYPEEDSVSVDIEHIKSKASFKSGVFASYHIYPYYPEFMNYQKEYINFKDEEGEINTYRAYLRDLISHHTIPVLVAEFGVPASRGMTHISSYSGYNQGNHDETEQGQIIAKLLKDIYAEGYCGGFVFTWQDEWFKRTWNTMELDLPDTRPYWSNAQTCEQEFGVLAFDPGKEKSICYVDGDISDWKDDKPLTVQNNLSLYVKSDEKYVYIMVQTEDYDFSNDSLYIGADTIPDQGNVLDKNSKLNFTRPADFLIQINGQDNSRIRVDAYYDSFYYQYAEQLNMLEKKPDYAIKGNGIFNPMNLCLSQEIVLPQDKKTVPFASYETGKLKYGDANPENPNFNSLTDFSYKDGNLEIRIPWQLLNVMDPSTKSVMGDLYKNKAIKPEKVDGFYFGGGILKKDVENAPQIEMNYYAWEPWTVPTYHERLKPSYYRLREVFKAIN